MLHPRHCNHIAALVERLKKRWNVSVYRYANVGNHLHLLIRAKTRADWKGFIRELAGGIPMIVTGARRGNALPRRRGQAAHTGAERAFWDHLVYTRIVAWGRDFAGVARYVAKNLWEGAGVPFKRLLARGYRILEMSEDGGILVATGGPD